jgi:hypothetical protein
MPIIDPDVRKLRFLAMVNSQVRGATKKEIAEEFRVSTRTVERTLSWGKRAGFIVEAEDHLLETLLPLAQTAIKAEIEREIAEGGAQTALKVWDKVVKGRDAKKGGDNAPGDDDELASIITSMRKQAALEERTVEGALVEPTANLLLLPAGAAERANSNRDEHGRFKSSKETAPADGQIDSEDGEGESPDPGWGPEEPREEHRPIGEGD